jgi:hypothetical protein
MRALRVRVFPQDWLDICTEVAHRKPYPRRPQEVVPADP